MFKFLFLNILNVSYKTIVSMYRDESAGESLVTFKYTYSPNTLNTYIPKPIHLFCPCKGENNNLLSGDVSQTSPII